MWTVPVIAELALVAKLAQTPSFPTTEEIASKCDSVPACVQAREDSRIQAVIDSEQYSLGNSYTPGQCTWFVSSRRSIGQFYGNANQWLQASTGYGHGSKPYRGAVAWTPNGYYGHVALVKQVDGDRVLVEEMNYDAAFTVDERWTSASDWQYIY